MRYFCDSVTSGFCLQKTLRLLYSVCLFVCLCLFVYFICDCAPFLLYSLKHMFCSLNFPMNLYWTKDRSSQWLQAVKEVI